VETCLTSFHPSLPPEPPSPGRPCRTKVSREVIGVPGSVETIPFFPGTSGKTFVIGAFPPRQNGPELFRRNSFSSRKTTRCIEVKTPLLL